MVWEDGAGTSLRLLPDYVFGARLPDCPGQPLSQLSYPYAKIIKPPVKRDVCGGFGSFCCQTREGAMKPLGGAQGLAAALPFDFALERASGASPGRLYAQSITLSRNAIPPGMFAFPCTLA